MKSSVVVWCSVLRRTSHPLAGTLCSTLSSITTSVWPKIARISGKLAKCAAVGTSRAPPCVFDNAHGLALYEIVKGKAVYLGTCAGAAACKNPCLEQTPGHEQRFCRDVKFVLLRVLIAQQSYKWARSYIWAKTLHMSVAVGYAVLLAARHFAARH